MGQSRKQRMRRTDQTALLDWLLWQGCELERLAQQQRMLHDCLDQHALRLDAVETRKRQTRHA